jgi:hypothetical protein
MITGKQLFEPATRSSLSGRIAGSSHQFLHFLHFRTVAVFLQKLFDGQLASISQQGFAVSPP